MSVLVCYDGSPSAKNAVATAAELFHGQQLTILHVWSAPVAAPTDAFSYREDPSGPSSEELDAFAQRGASEIAADGARIAHEQGAQPKCLTRCDGLSTWETIVKVADEEESSVIVVGAHPRGTAGPTLDSTSAGVAEHAHRPVLVVPMS